MDASRLSELRRWAASLDYSDVPELRAAGRAITALCIHNAELTKRIERLEREAERAASRSEAPRSSPAKALFERVSAAGGRSPQRSEPRRAPAVAPPVASSPRERPRPHGEPEEAPPAAVAPPSETATVAPPVEAPREDADAALDPATDPDAAEAKRRRFPGGLPWRLAVAAVAGAAALAGVVAFAAHAARPDLEAGGPAPGEVFGAQAMPKLAVWTRASDRDQEWLLNDRRVTPKRQGDRLVFRPAKLADGRHELVVRSGGGLLGTAERRFTFAVDTKPPVLKLARPATARPATSLVIEGTLERGARLTVGDADVPVRADGGFSFRSERLPPRNLLFVASDAAGNRSRWRVPVTLVPRRPVQPVRAVHVTAYAWADKTLREGILALAAAKKINAVELDLKDESGEIGWNANVPLGRRIGAVKRIFDLKQAVDQLHSRGIRVIGRLVCFRDPIHAAAAWRAGRSAEVVQTPGGGPYAGYGGFTNFANPAVRKYNIDVGVAAARLGVDEILYDYVRRPDGPLSSMVFPGLKGTPERAIVDFLRETRAALAGQEVLVGASVFGVAATRPKEVAQDIPAIAEQVDYIAPMVYPSHWAPGEYNVSDPNGSPYAITRRSLGDFVRVTRGTGARIVPWLQDFSLGRTYGPAEVAAQIEAARDAGADEFILWDPAVTYTSDALQPNAKVPALALSDAAPPDAPGPVRLPDPKPKPKATVKAGAPAAPQPAAAPPARPAAVGPTSGLPPNELGDVPVVMHHMIRADRVGEYDQTPAEFRAELERLWKEGYAPIRASDLVDGRIDVPAGKTPVVFTFDDSTRYQLAFDAKGNVRRDTAVGMMLEFARTHPGFEPAGTFYVNREPFGGTADATKLLRWLTENGFELGNHTHDHVPLRGVAPEEVQRQLALGAEVIERAVPGHRVRTMSLPLGAMPDNPRLAARGRWNGRSYGPYGVMLVGAGPAPSPFSKAFDPGGIPRIRTSHAGWSGEEDFALAYWLRELGRSPDRRFVSDGDRDRITVPKERAADVAPRFRARVATR